MTKELITIAVSSILATIGSVVAVLLVDYIKYKYIRPKQEFKKLKAKIHGVLIMYSNRITNPIKYEAITTENEKYYSEAQYALRNVAVELELLINEHDIKVFKGITIEQLNTVKGNLFYLSNALFITQYEQSIITATHNGKIKDEIIKTLSLKNETHKI